MYKTIGLVVVLLLMGCTKNAEDVAHLEKQFQIQKDNFQSRKTQLQQEHNQLMDELYLLKNTTIQSITKKYECDMERKVTIKDKFEVKNKKYVLIDWIKDQAPLLYEIDEQAYPLVKKGEKYTLRFNGQMNLTQLDLFNKEGNLYIESHLVIKEIMDKEDEKAVSGYQCEIIHELEGN